MRVARALGFTLIELVMVIVVLGILGVGIGSYIQRGTQLFIDTTERDQLIAESRFAVERLNRSIRNALPNSARTFESGKCIEFVPVVWSGVYDAIPIQPQAKASTMTVLDTQGINDSYQSAAANQHFVVIYPTHPARIYANNSQIRFALQALTDSDPNDNRQTLNFTQPQRFAHASVARRYYIVTQPVSYCISNSKVIRHSNYGYQTNSRIATIGAGEVMAENINSNSSQFQVSVPTLNRNGLVHALLVFEKGGERADFSQEIHIANAP